MPAPTLDPDLVQRGALFFLDPRLSADGQTSCATCHPGGGTNGQVYGGRDAPSLKGSWETPPYLRDGSAKTLEEAITRMQPYLGGRALAEEQRAALAAYVTAIPRFERGRVADTGEPLEPNTLRMRRGHEVFVRACAECHPPPLFTDRLRHDVDGAAPLDTPTLRGIADSAPYGHDGGFGSLKAAIRAQPQDEALSERDLENLIEYLKLL